MNKLQAIIRKTKFASRMVTCDNLIKEYNRLRFMRDISSQTNHRQSDIENTKPMIVIGAIFNKNKFWFMKHIKIEEDILYIEKIQNEIEIQKLERKALKRAKEEIQRIEDEEILKKINNMNKLEPIK